MRHFLIAACVLTAAVTLTACEKTDNYSSSEILSDPFAESGIAQSEEIADVSEYLPEQSSSSAEENPTKALYRLLTEGGMLATFGYDDEPYEYNGAPITMPVTVTANDDNLTDWSIGIMCCINGVMQRLTSDDQVDKTMIIKEDISPGETITLDITFDPMIAADDADKEQVKIVFLTTNNPTFQATEEFVRFAGRAAEISTYGSLYLNVRPVNITKPVTDTSYKEKIRTSERGYLPSYYRGDPQNIISYLNINSDKSLDFNVTASHLSEGEYYAFILQNNETVTFNDGKEYMKIDTEEKHEYDLDFHLDKAECGDAIECVFCQRLNFDDEYFLNNVVQTTGSCPVVREDFSI